jgi:signal transduction histidine kinase
MNAVVWQLAGWACAASAVAVLGLMRWRTGSRLALVAEASHELRGPLTAVRLGLATLLRDASPERARHAAALDLELQRAGLALEDLAAAPTGRRAAERPGPVDVADLLAEAREAWGPVALAFGTSVEIDLPAEWWIVRADRVRLAQALGNLVANAVEHGGGTPVRLRARGTGPKRLCLEVVDGGAGLGAPLAAAPRGHAGRRGHGLAVAARVAEACGGRLTSRHGLEGHVMALELPVLR